MLNLQLNKRHLQALLVLVTACFVATDVISGTGGTAFNPLYTFFEELVLEFCRKTVLIAAVALGAIFFIARVNPVPIIIGVAFAIFLNFSSGIINTIMTATV